MSQPPASSLAPRTLGLERRVSVRYACDEDARCHFGGGAAPRYESRWARVHDVSATGVGLRLSGPLLPERPLTLEFSEAGSSVRRVLRAWVVHCTARGDGTWVVGCRFHAPLSEDELWALATQAEP